MGEAGSGTALLSSSADGVYSWSGFNFDDIDGDDSLATVSSRIRRVNEDGYDSIDEEFGGSYG